MVKKETNIANINTLFQIPIQSKSTIGAFKSISISSILSNFSPLQSLHNTFLANANCKAIANYNYIFLSLNTLQYLGIKGLFDHVTQNKSRLCVTKEDQLLLYVRRKRGVGKYCIIYALEFDFILLNRKNEFIISALIGYAVNGIVR